MKKSLLSSSGLAAAMLLAFSGNRLTDLPMHHMKTLDVVPNSSNTRATPNRNRVSGVIKAKRSACKAKNIKRNKSHH